MLTRSVNPVIKELSDGQNRAVKQTFEEPLLDLYACKKNLLHIGINEKKHSTVCIDIYHVIQWDLT